MQNQNELNQPVTNREFQEHRKEFHELKDEFHEFVDFTAKTVATKDDLKEVKDELASFRKAAFEHFATKEDVRRIAEKSEARILESYDNVMISNDKVSKKLDILISELPAKAAVDREQNDRLDIIEERLNIGFVAA